MNVHKWVMMCTQCTQNLGTLGLFLRQGALDWLQEFLNVCTCVLECVRMKPYIYAHKPFVHKVHKVHDLQNLRAQGRLARLAYKRSVYNSKIVLKSPLFNPISPHSSCRPP